MQSNRGKAKVGLPQEQMEQGNQTPSTFSLSFLCVDVILSVQFVHEDGNFLVCRSQYTFTQLIDQKENGIILWLKFEKSRRRHLIGSG